MVISMTKSMLEPFARRIFSYFVETLFVSLRSDMYTACASSEMVFPKQINSL